MDCNSRLSAALFHRSVATATAIKAFVVPSADAFFLGNRLPN